MSTLITKAIAMSKGANGSSALNTVSISDTCVVSDNFSVSIFFPLRLPFQVPFNLPLIYLLNSRLHRLYFCSESESNETGERPLAAMFPNKTSASAFKL